MREYVVIYERGPRNWSAYVPDLPGCVSAGLTKDETEMQIREAIELHLEVMRERGERIPEPTVEVGKVQVAA
jgi:Uncharacterized conserved protein